MNEHKRLLSFIKPHIWLLVIGVVFAISAQLLQGVSIIGIFVSAIDKIVAGKDIVLAQNVPAPRILVDIVDKVNTTPPRVLINTLLLVFGIAMLIKPVLEFMHSYLMNKLSERVMRSIRDRLFEKFMALSFDFYTKNPTGKLVSKVIYDVTVLKNSLTQSLIDLIIQPAKLVVYIGMMLFVKAYSGISWRWLIIAVILLPTVIYPVRLIGKRLKKIASQMQEKMGDINVILHEAISGIRIVKAFLMEDYEKGRFRQQNKNFYKMSMKAIKKMLFVRPITEGVGVFCVVVLIWAGKEELLSGTFSFGALSALLFSLLSLMKPMKALGNIYGIIQQALSASNRIFEVLDTPISIAEKPGAVELRPLEKDITFKDVSFRYEKDGEDVLSDVNLTIDKGDILAIVGSSGVGKTTLVNLVPRFYDVTSGSVKIDGVDVKDVKVESLLKQIGIVTQDIILFNDTIKFNISYGKGGSKDDEARIIEAAKQANAHDFIKNLPKGYDTVIGEKGAMVSGGEKQRLAIARALFKNPPILILDEATSQLDTESERLVQDALNRLMEGRTVLVIAHRLSTIKHATKIVAMDKGTVRETGTHDELMASPSLYKKLYELQFKEF
jgi:subfamily B ATP-binding cassette protein MsbA